MTKEKWAVIDCGKTPSDINCQMKLMAPASDTDALVDTACYHVCKSHGHKDSQELRDAIRNDIVYENH